MIPKFCPKCGEPTSENFKFCKKCGNPLAVPTQPVTPPSVKAPVMPVPSVTDDGERTMLLDDSDARASAVNGVTEERGNTTPPVTPQPQARPIPPQPQSRPVPPPQPRPVVPQPQPRPVPQQKSGGNKVQTVIIVILIIILLAVLGVGGWFIFDLLNEKDNDDSAVDKESRSNSTYELVKANISWEDAAKKAEEKGGYLACIQDEDEEKEIIEYLNEEGADLKVVYIGGERKGDHFEWVNGDDFTYEDWTPGEPNNSNDIEKYVCLYNLDMQSDWGWNDCPDDMYQNYGGQFSGYTAYLIEYEEDGDRDDDDRDSDDRDDENRDEDDARREDEEER